MILKPKVICLFETEFDDFPTKTIPISIIDYVELSQPAAGNSFQEIKIYCSEQQDTNMFSSLLSFRKTNTSNQTQKPILELLFPNEYKRKSTRYDHLDIDVIKNGQRANIYQHDSKDTTQKFNYYYSITVKNSSDLKIWCNAIKRVAHDFKMSK